MSSSLRPSQVRSHILRDHDALRRQLDELTGVTCRIKDGDLGAAELALGLLKQVLDALSRHLDLEDAILAPTLRDDTDAFGPVRAERLLRHHVDQRTQLRSLVDRSHTEHGPLALAGMIGELIEDLRADMAYEERDVLSAELLRDDPMSSGEDG